MSENTKELSPEEKVWAVKEYLSGKGSTYSIADKYGVTDTSIRRWVDRYKIEGEQAFHKKPLASSLSQEEKLRAVHEYLQGVLSLRDIALKYGVGDTSVRKWIAKYNAGGDAALIPNHAKKHYSKSFQQEVIRAYLAGEGSMQNFVSVIIFPLLILSESGACSIMTVERYEALKREELRS